MLSRVSANDGATWGNALRLTNAARASYRVNDEPSIALTGSVERVSYVRYQRSFTHYDVWMRSSH